MLRETKHFRVFLCVQGYIARSATKIIRD